jgi:hypothetical protein
MVSNTGLRHLGFVSTCAGLMFALQAGIANPAKAQEQKRDSPPPGAKKAKKKPPRRQGRSRKALARPTTSKPVIDGKLDDNAWRTASRHGTFTERVPRLYARPPVRTSFRVLYDAGALYVAVELEETQPDKLRALTRGRDDSSLFRDDAISLKIDPTNDDRTTIGFSTNLAGARLDYRGIDESQFRTEYDVIWQAAASRTAKGWSVEFMIPWRALGVDPSQPPKSMGFNLSRDHSRRNATYDWAVLAPPFSPIAASQYGTLTGFEKLTEITTTKKRTLRSLQAIPYALGGMRRNLDSDAGEGDNHQSESLYNAGLDVNANMGRFRGQLTLNTDFAQVDLDNQVVNLTRFGLFLPEKRNFFLSDLEVLSFGRAQEAQMLYSRRMGLSGQDIVPILSGLKLVGRPHEKLRLGVLQVTTRPSQDVPWNSHAVVRGLYELGGGSNLGLMATQRQSLENSQDNNIMLGVDGAFRGEKVPVLIQSFAIASLTGADAGDPQSAVGGDGRGEFANRLAPGAGIAVSLRDNLWRPSLSYLYLHPELRGDLGFFRRVGIQTTRGSLALVPQIGRGGIREVEVGTTAELVAGTRDDALLDHNASGYVVVRWDKGYSLGASAGYYHITAQDDFEVGRNTTIGAAEYTGPQASIRASTPGSYPFSTYTTLSYRDYFGGDAWSANGGLSYAPSPLLRLDVGYDAVHAIFADDRANFDSLVMNGRATIGFAPRLGLRLFGAYNLLGDVVQMQSRLRWIYLPGSDLFLVYQLNLDDDTGRALFMSFIAKTQFRIDVL